MIEIRVPISPTPSFLNRAVLLAASARRFYPDTIVRAYIGQSGGVTPDAAQRVGLAFSDQDIGWEWVGAREFDAWEGTRSPYLGTMNRRWKKPVDGDHVLIVDCDVLMTGRIDDLLAVNAVQGVQAHVAPLTVDQWRYLFAINGCEPPAFDHVYSGAGIMGPPGQRGVWYVNSGMCLMTRDHFEQMCPHYHGAVNVIRGAMKDSYWADQLALALAAAKAKVPVKTLPTRYNHPNQHAFDTAYPDELADIRFIHYLREDLINRTTDFESVEALRKLVARTDLTGGNEIVRQTVAETMGCLEP